LVFQEPPLTHEEVEDLLVRQPIATLCTQNSDGTIHAAPIWYKYSRGELVFGTQQDSRRVKNIKRNQNVTVVVDERQVPYKGVIIYGKAKLDFDDVISKRVNIFEKYMPKANAEGLAQGLAKLRKLVVIRVIPGKMVSYDYAKDQSGLFK
jgi:nitroimidazol reductase NimA-like FMN-containing flavoprotein (pyridoxamine 5'-phosphate oxidase superfamily)